MTPPDYNENREEESAMTIGDDLVRFAAGRLFTTVLIDAPWRFTNSTGKVAPEHRRLRRYATLTTNEICALPIADILADNAHVYSWVPNALLPDGLRAQKRPGASRTRPTSSGTRSGRTAALTAGVWASGIAM